MNVDSIPAINAALNGLAIILITTGFVFIKNQNISAHRTMMSAAFAVSVVFLFLYVLHKILVAGVHTPFGGEGPIRTIYFVMLVSHIVLAMAVVPLVLRTLYLAVRGRYMSHRRWAAWTFPVWYYVSVTGVLIYFFLYHWFPVGPA